MSSFEEFVDVEGLDAAEQARLRRVHELLLEAGPPPVLPGSLERAPAATHRRVLAFPARRRLAAGLALAAALAAAAFGGGYVVGHGSGGGSGTVRVAALSGHDAVASLTVSKPDGGGNWPIELRVSGLPRLEGRRSYYELFVSEHGKPGFPCGGFKVSATSPATVRFSVPYRVEDSTRWVLTAVDEAHPWPGRVLMT